MTLHPRLDWESGYVLTDALESNAASRWPWQQSLGVAWQMVGWALQHPEGELVHRFLEGDIALLDTGTTDMVVAALGLAILSEAWRCDTRPDSGDMTLAGIAAQLDDLADHRQAQPLGDGHPDDLWPLLAALNPAELGNAAELARCVLNAHAADGTDTRTVSVADRLPRCPRHLGSGKILHAVTRRQLDQYIRPRLARRVQTGGQWRITDTTVLSCPDCGATRRLQLSSEAGGTDVTATCPDGHSWPVPEVSPSDLESILQDEAQRRADHG